MRGLLDDAMFKSWPMILASACLFSILFGLAAAMVDFLFDGELKLSGRVFSFSTLAFFGFVGVALRLRRDHDAIK